MKQRFQSPLDQHEGLSLLSTHDALLKGVLESELPVACVTGAGFGPFGAMFRRAGVPAAHTLLHQHGTQVVAVRDPNRAVTMAAYASSRGEHAIVTISNAQLDEAMQSLVELAGAFSPRHGGVGLVIEDDPERWPAACPRRAALRLGIAAVEATSIEGVRDHVENVLRLSIASNRPAALIIHRSLMRSVQTIRARPNRVGGVESALVRRRRRARVGRGVDFENVLRQGRLLELNQLRAMPNPGEAVSLGFITVGVADLALQHVIAVLQLYGRLPVLHLSLVNPVDDAAVERLLSRCQRVIVLEPRPGTIEQQVLAVAEQMRQKGLAPATIWGRRLPPDQHGQSRGLTNDRDLHASILVRRLRDLFADMRPDLDLGKVLQPDPPDLMVEVTLRGKELGAQAAENVVRRVLADVQDWLDKRHEVDESVGDVKLVMHGDLAPEAEERAVVVEIFDQSHFLREAASAIGQAARANRPSILLVLADDSQTDLNLQRFARGVTPRTRAERVHIEQVNLADLAAFRTTLRRVALEDAATIVIVQDGPPPQFNVGAIERSFAEVDELGFQPTLRLTRPTELACAVRPQFDESIEERLSTSDPNRLRTEVSFDRAPRRPGGAVQVRVRPRLEQVEVIRVRPPVRPWKRLIATSLSPPSPIHGRHSAWRAHFAGYRADGPGVAARILCDAARRMGYVAQAVHDPSPIGFGRRAWAQVLLMSPREGEWPDPQVGLIPYGEADVLIGLDAMETLRAVGPDPSLRIAHADRTFIVANLGEFADDIAGEAPLAETDFIRAIREMCRLDVHRVGDFSRACRVWLKTDRLTDIALLGATYQLGLIPVSLDAIDDAVQAAEDQGCGRATEAFEFGRHLAAEPKLFVRPRLQREESADRMLRRLVLSLRHSRFRGAARAERFERLVSRSLSAMPGLMDTEPGRQARRDFIAGMYHCLQWGGENYAEKFAMVITRMYELDRPDRGRDITRNAVLPLAEAMLVRDAIYIATMSMSDEHRRQLRAMLGVRHARGDRIERRFLLRADLMLGRRRLRMDLRTGSGTIYLLSLLRKISVARWRGSRRQRDLRARMIQFMDNVLVQMGDRYAEISAVMHRINESAVSGVLQRMNAHELEQLMGASLAGDAARPGQSDSDADPTAARTQEIPRVEAPS